MEYIWFGWSRAVTLNRNSTAEARINDREKRVW
jgi:hypothetical protein